MDDEGCIVLVELDTRGRERLEIISDDPSSSSARLQSHDTLETATTWKNLMTLHSAVKQALLAAIEHDGESPLVLTHLSHAYETGASLYYTFMARQKPGQELAQWQRVKSAATDAIVRNGGALSHHHGIGTVHQPWMKEYLGDLAAKMMRSIKTVVDPEGIMNPGLSLDEGDVPAASIIGDFSHRIRAANIDRFAHETFDLAIIGGGITGSAIARDATLRGLKVALVEKGDFASGTSSKSSKMICVCGLSLNRACEGDGGFDRIPVPVDFYDNSRRASDQARELATGTTLLVASSKWPRRKQQTCSTWERVG